MDINLATIQFFDKRKIPAITPTIVAIKQPKIATTSVFRIPTNAALACVLSFEYSINRWFISYPARIPRKLKLTSLPINAKFFNVLSTNQKKTATKIINVITCKEVPRYRVSLRSIPHLNFSCGKLKKFNLDIFLEGSILQKKIWKELQRIPYGKIKTYGEIAKNLNTSPRYVGNVCGQNNHLLVIPCHRVVRSDGSLGGFSGLGGIKLKKKLINN